MPLLHFFLYYVVPLLHFKILIFQFLVYIYFFVLLFGLWGSWISVFFNGFILTAHVHIKPNEEDLCENLHEDI